MYSSEFLKSVFEEGQNILYKILTRDKKVFERLVDGVSVSVFPDGMLMYGEEKESVGYEFKSIYGRNIGRIILSTPYLYSSEDFPYMISSFDVSEDLDFGDLIVGKVGCGVDDLSDFFIKDSRFLRDFWRELPGRSLVVEEFVDSLQVCLGSPVVLREELGKVRMISGSVVRDVSDLELGRILGALPDKPINKISWISGRSTGRVYIRRSSVLGEYDILLR